MTLLLALLAASFTALCVWLGVRLVNRREKWVKWTLAGLAGGVPVLYFASFGPACWIESRRDYENEGAFDDVDFLPFYRPVEFIWEHAPEPIANVINRYCYAFAAPDWQWIPLACRNGACCFYPFSFSPLTEQESTSGTSSSDRTSN